MARMLEVKDLCVSYGAIDALRDINLSVDKGSIVAILGANGAGKSTLLRTISGVVKPRQGSIMLDGKHELSGMYPYKIAGMGVIQSPEGRLILQGLTTEENLLVGSYGLKSADGQNKASRVQNNLDNVFSLFPILKERRKQQANTLSGGEQQMLAVARILRTGARLLLLDEISEGLAPVIVQALARMITTLRQKGFTVVMVEQNFRFAAPLADRFYVMEHGRMVEHFAASELQAKMPVLTELLGV